MTKSKRIITALAAALLTVAPIASTAINPNRVVLATKKIHKGKKAKRNHVAKKGKLTLYKKAKIYAYGAVEEALEDAKTEIEDKADKPGSDWTVTEYRKHKRLDDILDKVGNDCGNYMDKNGVDRTENELVAERIYHNKRELKLVLPKAKPIVSKMLKKYHIRGLKRYVNYSYPTKF